MKIKVDPADSLFSKLIRERDGWKCMFCGTQYEPPTSGLQCSHFWGRGHKATRWDPENCDALCYGCHARNEGNKQGFYREFKIKQLGMKAYRALEKRSKTLVKYGQYNKKQVLAHLKEFGLSNYQGLLNLLK